MLLDPWEDTNNKQHENNNRSPELNIQHIQIIVRLRSADNRSREEQQQRVPARAVVLPDFLRVCLAAVQLGRREHGEPNRVLG